MAQILYITYILIFFLGIGAVIITRLLLIIQLYSIKNGKLFAETIEMEILSFMTFMMFPFKLENEFESPKHQNIVSIQNKLRKVHWWLLVSFLVFMIANFVLNYVFDYQVFD